MPSVPMATLSWPRDAIFHHFVSFALEAGNPATDPVTFHAGATANFPDSAGSAVLSLAGDAGDVMVVAATVRFTFNPAGSVNPAGSYKPSGFTHVGSVTHFDGVNRWHMTSVWVRLLASTVTSVTVPDPGHQPTALVRSKAAGITLRGLPGLTYASTITTDHLTGGTQGAPVTPTLPDVTARHYTGICVSGIRNNFPNGIYATGTGWATYSVSAGDNATDIAYLLEGYGPPPNPTGGYRWGLGYGPRKPGY